LTSPAGSVSLGHDQWRRRRAGGSTVRVTHVYRREDGEWKIVHRHGDSAALDLRPSADASPT
jgi:ketosteroid isomerase-like protein